MMAAVARPKRRICEIKQALANARADTEAHADKPEPTKKKPRLRWRELTMDVAQYLAEWMPGENGCQEAWLEQKQSYSGRASRRETPSIFDYVRR